jgi:hypothetical protein
VGERTDAGGVGGGKVDVVTALAERDVDSGHGGAPFIGIHPRNSSSTAPPPRG